MSEILKLGLICAIWCAFSVGAIFLADELDPGLAAGIAVVSGLLFAVWLSNNRIPGPRGNTGPEGRPGRDAVSQDDIN